MLREHEPSRDPDFDSSTPTPKKKKSSTASASGSSLPRFPMGNGDEITSYETLTPTCASITVTKAMLIRSLLSQVTVDGRPFSSLNDISFSTFSVPAMKALNIHYDPENIGELVEQAAEHVKQKLKTDIKNSLVCVKVDCATRSKRSFIGINLQVQKFLLKN